MIFYHPKDDSIHCIFRFLYILSVIEESSIELDRLKIIDFYLLFPTLLLSDDKTPVLPVVKGLTKPVKEKLKKLADPHERMPSHKILFSSLGDYQLQALDVMRAQNLCHISQDNVISRGECFHSVHVTRLTQENNSFSENSMYAGIIKLLMQRDLHGSAGLKARSKLMEYRYDAI